MTMSSASPQAEVAGSSPHGVPNVQLRRLLIRRRVPEPARSPCAIPTFDSISDVPGWGGFGDHNGERRFNRLLRPLLLCRFVG